MINPAFQETNNGVSNEMFYISYPIDDQAIDDYYGRTNYAVPKQNELNGFAESWLELEQACSLGTNSANVSFCHSRRSKPNICRCLGLFLVWLLVVLSLAGIFASISFIIWLKTYCGDNHRENQTSIDIGFGNETLSITSFLEVTTNSTEFIN